MTLISLDQTAEILGIETHVLRRVRDTTALSALHPQRSTSKHLRFSLKQVLNNYDTIVQELSLLSRTGIPLGHDWEERGLERINFVDTSKLRKVLDNTYSADEASRRLGVSRPALRRLEQSGSLIAARPIGPKQTRYFKESVESVRNNGAA